MDGEHPGKMKKLQAGILQVNKEPPLSAAAFLGVHLGISGERY